MFVVTNTFQPAFTGISSSFFVIHHKCTLVEGLGTIVQGPTIENVTWEKLKGKVVVLEFWNTACGPCIQAIPHMNELVTQFSYRPVVFLCVSDDNQDHLKKFLGRKPIKGWVALDAPLMQVSLLTIDTCPSCPCLD